MLHSAYFTMWPKFPDLFPWWLHLCHHAVSHWDSPYAYDYRANQSLSIWETWNYNIHKTIFVWPYVYWVSCSCTCFHKMVLSVYCSSQHHLWNEEKGNTRNFPLKAQTSEEVDEMFVPISQSLFTHSLNCWVRSVQDACTCMCSPGCRVFALLIERLHSVTPFQWPPLAQRSDMFVSPGFSCMQLFE